MFVLCLGAKENQRIIVHRNDVVMIHRDQEYKMPTFKELRKKYGEQAHDEELLLRLGQESLSLSPMRYLKYQTGIDFFPPPGQDQFPNNEASMDNDYGFRTRIYFKNPGFKKGDQIIIKVKDKNKPDLTGAVAVILQ